MTSITANTHTSLLADLRSRTKSRGGQPNGTSRRKGSRARRAPPSGAASSSSPPLATPSPGKRGTSGSPFPVSYANSPDAGAPVPVDRAVARARRKQRRQARAQRRGTSNKQQTEAVHAHSASPIQQQQQQQQQQQLPVEPVAAPNAVIGVDESMHNLVAGHNLFAADTDLGDIAITKAQQRERAQQPPPEPEPAQPYPPPSTEEKRALAAFHGLRRPKPQDYKQAPGHSASVGITSSASQPARSASANQPDLSRTSSDIALHYSAQEADQAARELELVELERKRQLAAEQKAVEEAASARRRAIAEQELMAEQKLAEEAALAQRRKLEEEKARERKEREEEHARKLAREERSRREQQRREEEERLAALERRKHELLRMVTRGDMFIKHGRKGSPHAKFVMVDSSLDRVWWSDSQDSIAKEMQKFAGKSDKSSSRSIAVKDINIVTTGHTTKVFARMKEKEQHRTIDMSFSLITHYGRSLDLVASSKQVRNDWVEFFRNILEEKD